MNLCHLVGGFLALLLDSDNELGIKPGPGRKNSISSSFGEDGPKKFWKSERTDEVRKQHPLIIIM